MLETGVPPSPEGSPLPEKKLVSWKEIAAHLRREVRTVQRWEKTEGLPVKRHEHQKKSTVYAYPSELDDLAPPRLTSMFGRPFSHIASTSGRQHLPAKNVLQATRNAKAEPVADVVSCRGGAPAPSPRKLRRDRGRRGRGVPSLPRHPS